MEDLVQCHVQDFKIIIFLYLDKKNSIKFYVILSLINSDLIFLKSCLQALQL